MWSHRLVPVTRRAATSCTDYSQQPVLPASGVTYWHQHEHVCVCVCGRSAEVDAEESASLKQLQALVGIACEYLGLWKILCDHQFHVIAGAITPVCLLLLLHCAVC